MPSVLHIKEQFNAFKIVTPITNEISILHFAELVLPEIVPYKSAYSVNLKTGYQWYRRHLRNAPAYAYHKLPEHNLWTCIDTSKPGPKPELLSNSSHHTLPLRTRCTKIINCTEKCP